VSKQGPNPSTDRNREFVRLLARHESRLSIYVHSLVPIWADAEDILQETKVRLWEQFDSFEVGTDFGAWACTVARYMVLESSERSARKKLYFHEDVEELISARAKDRADAADLRRNALAFCIAKLDLPSRKLLQQFYAEGLKVKQIAESVGRTTQSVYSAISRSRQALRKCIERQLAKEETA